MLVHGTEGFWGAYASINNAGRSAAQLQLINPTILRVRFNPGCDDWVLQYAVNLAVPPEFTTWADDEPGNLTPDGEELTRDFQPPTGDPNCSSACASPDIPVQSSIFDGHLSPQVAVCVPPITQRQSGSTFAKQWQADPSTSGELHLGKESLWT